MISNKLETDLLELRQMQELEAQRKREADKKKQHAELRDLFHRLNVGQEEKVVEDFLSYLEQEHRTLVQLWFRTTVVVMARYHERCPHPDARNEASVEFSEKLYEMLIDGRIRFPFI